MKGLQPATPEAMKLLMDGTLAMSHIEQAGLRVDMGYLAEAIKQVKVSIVEKEARLQASKEYQVWARYYGNKMNLRSKVQKGHVVFDLCGHRRNPHIDAPNSEAAFEHVPSRFVKDLADVERLKKALVTNLYGIQNEVVDGRIHPFFDVGSVESYRSCIARGTLIEVVRDVSEFPKGIPIEDVRAGDLVYCYDKHCRLTIKQVSWAGKTGTRQVIRLHWRARGKRGHLDLTPEHRVRLANGEYVQAQDLVGDFRGPETPKKAPKIRVLSMGRQGDRIWETNSTELKDHRLVYEKCLGSLSRDQVVHHRDGNHLNNHPPNLERMTQAEHARLHAPFVLTDDVRRLSVRKRVANHSLYGDRFASGEDHPGWISLSRFGWLRLLARVKGKISKANHCFQVMRKRCHAFGIEWQTIKTRYDREGLYISRQRIQDSISEGGRSLQRAWGLGYYALREMLKTRGFSLPRKDAIPNNHRIVRVEWINKTVDVYDLEVPGEHNFIANEICVHNSSSRVNFQNQPVRNKDISKIVRSCIIPDPGCVLVEVDYSTQEVRVSYCYHRDPSLKYDILHGDMHRDRALDLFCLTPEELGPVSQEPGKTIRYVAKNRFVFAQFYGSTYPECAAHLWDAISLYQLKRADGTSLYDHLADKGIKKLGLCNPEFTPRRGTYEHHVAEVQRQMWEERYPVYNQWKQDWWNLYERQAGIQTLTGFVLAGDFRRNQILCDPIQGCVRGSTKVLTREGHIPIRELVGKSAEVWTGFRWANAVGLAKGKWQAARIYLSSGIVMDVDTRHKFKSEFLDWVSFKDLKVGDRVALPVVPLSLSASEKITWPFVFGFILGDGHLARRLTANGRYVSFCVGAKKRSVLWQIRDFLLHEGYRPRKFQTGPKGTRKRKYGFRLESTLFADLLEEAGFSFDWRSRTKRVPKSVWVAPLQDRRDFLEGLWLSDGSRVRWQERNLHTPNQELLREVQELMAPLGFDSNLCQTKQGWLLRVCPNDGKHRPHRHYPKEALLAVTHGMIRRQDYANRSDYSTDTSSFYRKASEVSQRVGERIIRQRNSEAETYRFDQVVKIETLNEEEDTYTMSVDDPLHQFTAGGVICKNSAFHCLLWTIINVQREILRQKMRSRIICQIHDSVLASVPIKELGDYIELVRLWGIERVAQHWKWITCPLAMDLEVASDNWFEKHPMKETA